jgi:hypothetical protein
MRQWVRWLLALAFALGMPRAAWAQYTTGVNLSWGDCGALGTLDQTFACNTNVGLSQIIASVIAPANADSVIGGGFVADVTTAGAAYLEPYWEVYSGGCRGVGMSFNFREFAYTAATCSDLWGGIAASGVPVFTRELLGYTVRLRGVLAVTSGQALTEGQEYFFAYLTVTHSRTVGPYSCSGCASPACFALNEIDLDQPGPNAMNWRMAGAPVGGRDYVTWQGAGTADCAAVPTRKKSWGQIKALYR